MALTFEQRMASLNDEQLKPEGSMTFEERMLSLDAIPESEPVPEMSTMDNIKGGIRALGQGMTFNLNDEAASAMGAFGGMASDFITGDEDDRGFGERYSDQMEASKTLRDQYSAANPKTALGLEIAGAFTGGGAGAAKVLSTQAVKNAPKLKKAIAASLTGGTEGAVMGFGSGNSLEDRIDKGKTGLGLGLALPLALSGAGALTRGAANKFKLDKKLENFKGKQMSLALADPDGIRGSFYRNIVAPAFGGNKIVEDAAPFVQRAEDKVISAKNRGKTVAEALRKAGLRSDENANLAAVNATTNATNKVAQVTEDARQATLQANQTANAADVVTQAQSKLAITNATQAAKDAAKTKINDVDTAFRGNVTVQSMPDKISDDTLSKLGGANSQQITKMLGDEWVKNGFKVVTQKGKKFTPPDVQTLTSSVKRIFNNDPVLRRQSEGYADDFIDMYKEIIRKDGTVTGADLMEFRNTYARTANNATDPIQRQIMNTYKQKIDDIIQDGLKGSDDDLAAYARDKKAWDMFTNMRTATGKAANRKQGDWTADDWLSSTQNRRLAKEGGPEQSMAQEVQLKIKSINEEMGFNIRDLPERKAAVTQKANSKVTLSKAKEKARAEGAEKIDQAKQGLAKTKAANTVNKANAKEAVRVRGQRATSTAERQLTKARDELKKISKNAGTKKAGLATRLIATGLLGGAGFVGGPAGTAAIGTLHAKTLASDFVQRIISGQSVDKALDALSAINYKGLSLADTLRQGTTAGAIQGQNE